MNKRISQQEKFKKIFIIISVSFLILIIGTVIYAANNQKDITKCKYTETLVETADLVKIDGYYVGQGILEDITHYRFQVEDNGVKSYDMDVNSRKCSLVYVDDPVNDQYKDRLGKAYAYDREYQVSDGKTEKTFYYVLYVTKDTVNDCGSLDVGEEE